MKRHTIISTALGLAAATTLAATGVVAWWIPDDQDIALEPASVVEPVEQTDPTDSLTETEEDDESSAPAVDPTGTVAQPTAPQPGADTDQGRSGSDVAEPGGEDEGDTATDAFSIAFDTRTLRVTGPDGNDFAWELDATRNEAFADVAVRPGTSALDLDAIVTVVRGEVPRLYELTIRGGSDAVFAEVPAHLQPQTVLESVITPRFTPDGRSVLWTEPTAEGVTLRSFGWDDGAGTGRAADDNASFALDLPADIHVISFRPVGDDTAGATATRWTAVFTDGVGDTHTVEMARQADGGLSVRG